jgi:3-methylfumaryl-CoA hydratase
MTDDFSAWVGKTQTAIDRLEPARSNALRAILGDEPALDNGDALPVLHHWLYFWDVRAGDALARDGHLARGDFLPPISLPRRMWAGGRLEFHAPLLLGEQVQKQSTIQKIQRKSGNSEELIFVTVRHELSGEGGLAISEEQDIVYREAAKSNAAAAPESEATPRPSQWRQSLMPDPVLLFRYSALTMNGHRIHYDRPYAETEEDYPALVVHGPLQATLLAMLAEKGLQRPLRRFEFRGKSAAFEGRPLDICGDIDGDGATLWTEQQGLTNMVATAR